MRIRTLVFIRVVDPVSGRIRIFLRIRTALIRNKFETERLINYTISQPNVKFKYHTIPYHSNEIKHLFQNGRLCTSLYSLNLSYSYFH
jgi:hypothetical protein